MAAVKRPSMASAIRAELGGEWVDALVNPYRHIGDVIEALEGIDTDDPAPADLAILRRVLTAVLAALPPPEE